MSLRSLCNSISKDLSIDTIESLCRKQDRVTKIKTGYFELKQISDESKVSGHLKRLIKEKRWGITNKKTK